MRNRKPGLYSILFHNPLITIYGGDKPDMRIRAKFSGLEINRIFGFITPIMHNFDHTTLWVDYCDRWGSHDVRCVLRIVGTSVEIRSFTSKPLKTEVAMAPPRFYSNCQGERTPTEWLPRTLPFLPPSLRPSPSYLPFSFFSPEYRPRSSRVQSGSFGVWIPDYSSFHIPQNCVWTKTSHVARITEQGQPSHFE